MKLLDRHLQRIKNSVLKLKADAQLKRELHALDELKRIREEAQKRYGIYEGDIIAEVRAERDRQMDAVFQDEYKSGDIIPTPPSTQNDGERYRLNS